MTIRATFNADATGAVVVEATASDYLAAVDRAYTKLMALPVRPPASLQVRRVR